MFRGGTFIRLALLVALATLAQFATALGAQAATTTLKADADALVSGASGERSKAYGNWMSLNVDGSPVRQAYMRFVIPSTVGTVTSATLRLYAVDGSSDGGSVYRVANNTWNEYTTTWNTRPALGASLGAIGPVAVNTFKSIDLSGYIQGPGTYSIALAKGDDDAIWFVSREGDPSQAPQLVLSSSGSTGDTQAPSKPANLQASTTPSPLAVNLSWSASTDDIGVTGYDVKRNGTTIATVTGTSYKDSNVQPSTGYSYTVVAKDAAGNASTPADPVSVTTPSGSPPPPPATLDDFERTVSGTWGTGSLGSWSYQITAGSPFALDVNGHVAEAHSSSGVNKGNLVVGSAFSGAAAAQATFTASYEPSSGTPNHWQVILRRQGPQTYYAAQLYPNGSGNASLVIFAAKSGTFPDIAEAEVPFPVSTDAAYVIRFSVSDASDGVHLAAKAWPAGTSAPASWQTTGVDGASDKLTSGQAGVRLSMYAGPVVATVDDFSLTKP